MNRSTDTRDFTEDHPGFLSSNVDTDNDASCEFEPEEEATHHDDADVEEACEDNYDENDYEEHLEDEDPAPYEPPTVRRTGRRRQTATRSPAGGLLMTVGVLVAVAGAAMAFMPTATAAIAKIIEPQILVILGVALAAIASGMLRTSRLQLRLEQIESRRNEFDDELSDTLARFAEHSSPEPATSDAKDVQHLMLSLQRQDQKINNLTKAIKMYGKPLMEIAGQRTELAGNMAQLRTLVEGAAESNRQAINRMEKQVRSSASDMQVAALPEQISKLEASLNGITEQVDSSTESLTKGIDQMRNGNLSDLESSVREIQRELGALATRMSQIQATANNGVNTTGAGEDAAPDSQGDDKQADDYATGQRRVAGDTVLGAIAKLKQMKG